ncbi:hypothetical protein NPIL_688371 [Nephila pilipes]|uniref:Uncharacterized protein n=1 Tax=Nephila pilipes TaxID=299642 RepID=A0A8X6UPA0_NEPPI|nr:hypothetical protein NPIL_688371 [Nephila pilipes]
MPDGQTPKVNHSFKVEFRQIASKETFIMSDFVVTVSTSKKLYIQISINVWFVSEIQIIGRGYLSAITLRSAEYAMYDKIVMHTTYRLYDRKILVSAASKSNHKTCKQTLYMKWLDKLFLKKCLQRWTDSECQSSI